MLSCALALVLLIDVSGSISLENYQLQAKGLQQAFLEPEIQNAITSKPGGIAVTIIEWASNSYVMQDWHHLTDNNSISEFAAKIEIDSRRTSGVTAIEKALHVGIESFQTTPCKTEHKIIDISGDGEDNSGGSPERARDLANNQGITINALPIVTEYEPDIEEYYRKFIITNDGFAIKAKGFADFARALRRKLILELAEK